MIYFIILLILIILLIPQVYYKKSNKLMQNYGLDLTCDIEFMPEVEEIDDLIEFGNEKDFFELPNFERVKIKSYDGFVLDGGFFPVEDPKALVQIIHGALEHKERYYYLIKYLNERGYSCFITDNRGHGRSRGDIYTTGYIDGVEKVADDNLAITRQLKKKFPDTDIYLVLSGPPNYVPEVPLAIFLGNFINFYFGEQRTIFILKQLYTGEKKHFDWLSYSKENIKDAEKDPHMPSVFKNRGYLAVFEGVRELKNTKNYKFKNPDLDILFIAGQDDVVIGGKEGFESSINILKEVGYKNIESKLYKMMKHEIFREEEREEVFKDIVDFLEK